MYYEGCTIDEVRAYRELEGEVFNFGEGKIKIDGWFESEDAYYEMSLPEESGREGHLYNIPKPKKKHKTKLHKYYKKQIDKKQLNKLNKVGWWLVSTKETHQKRCYYSNRKKMAKKMTNRKIRQYKGKIGNGGSYRKIYDYWWSVF